MIFDKPILTKANIAYFCIAVFVGVVLAFGIASMTYQPVPLQVKEDVYAPVPPPPQAVPTQAPQYIPGSSADLQKDTLPDQFAPALPPVIVTTMPLPSITPDRPVAVVLTTDATRKCIRDPSAQNASAGEVSCVLYDSLIEIVKIEMQLMPIMILVIFVLMFSKLSLLRGRYVIIPVTAAFFFWIGWF